MPDDVHLIKEIRDIRARRLLRTLAVVQDLSDALMAINDVTGTAVHAISRPILHQLICCWIALCCQHACFLALMGLLIDQHSPRQSR